MTDKANMTTARYRHIAPRKIVDLNLLLSHRAAARASGKTVVHCHGCFDIVHPGHIRYFQFAKQQGDILVVSLTGDRLHKRWSQSIRRLLAEQTNHGSKKQQQGHDASRHEHGFIRQILALQSSYGAASASVTLVE